ncbi:MAG: sensor histidine kinase YesM [Roseivirga sp.]
MKLNRSHNIGIVIFLVLTSIGFLLLSNSEAPRSYYLTLGWIDLMLILIFVFNRLLTNLLDNKLPWLVYGNKRFYTQLVLGILISLAVINLSYLIFKFALTQDPPDATQLASINALGILVLMPVISINFGIQFLRNWKDAQLASENFQKESIKAELTILKNHLDPHFLFNNLNILSSLISKDQKQSQAYLEKFAEVYRIILQSSSEELVELKQELGFINAYMYLLSIRFEETIQLEMHIDKSLEQLYIPPLTLQMLIENAIKHNLITETKPLKISIESRSGFLVIKNNLQEKKVEVKDSNKSGLENIKKRYSYFTDQKVEVNKNATSFIVKVPLINISEI